VYDPHDGRMHYGVDRLLDSDCCDPDTRNESDSDHARALQTTGFWGRQGAGAIVLSRATGRILLPFRSGAVEQPHTWGVWGGAIDSDEDPEDAARREVSEETGYSGHIEMHPLVVFTKGKFQYHNFLAIVDDEFTPSLNWETEDAGWFTFGDWPSPLHFGLGYLLQHSGDAIKNRKMEGIREAVDRLLESHTAYMWHISPRENRESILAHGLNWELSSENDRLEGGIHPDAEPAENEWPRGQYLFKDRPEHTVAAEGMDIYRVRVDGLTIKPDPYLGVWNGQTFVTFSPIPADRVELIEKAWEDNDPRYGNTDTY